MECRKCFPDNNFNFVDDVEFADNDELEAVEGKDIMDADSGNNPA